MVENIDCKQVLVALHGPDSLEAEVGTLGQFVLSEPRVFEGDVICLIMSRNGMIDQKTQGLSTAEEIYTVWRTTT